MPTPTAAKSTSTRSTSPTSPARATAAHERHRRPAMTTPAHPVPPLARLTRAGSTASSALGLTAGAAPYSNQGRWVSGCVAAGIVLVGATLLVLWTVAGFGDLGVSGHGLVALILGIVFTTALGIGLMALSFYGDHSDQPEDSRRSDAKVERDAE